MCGIAGFNLNPRDADRLDTWELTADLAIGIEHRGPHATGYAWTDADSGEVWIEKAALKASTFVEDGHILEDLDNARNVLIHTRYYTKGSPKMNGNNHPIIRPGIVGTHNGVLRNDEQLWRANPEWTRLAEVDSEVIFAAIADSGKPAGEALGMIEGDAAVAWIETDRPHTLRLGRLSGRPLVLAQTKAGSLIYCSEERPLVNALKYQGIPRDELDILECPTWAVLTVREGRITEQGAIPQPKHPEPAYRHYGRTGRAAVVAAARSYDPGPRLWSGPDWRWDDDALNLDDDFVDDETGALPAGFSWVDDDPADDGFTPDDVE